MQARPLHSPGGSFFALHVGKEVLWHVQQVFRSAGIGPIAGRARRAASTPQSQARSPKNGRSTLANHRPSPRRTQKFIRTAAQSRCHQFLICRPSILGRVSQRCIRSRRGEYERRPSLQGRRDRSRRAVHDLGVAGVVRLINSRATIIPESLIPHSRRGRNSCEPERCREEQRPKWLARPRRQGCSGVPQGG